MLSRPTETVPLTDCKSLYCIDYKSLYCMGTAEREGGRREKGERGERRRWAECVDMGVYVCVFVQVLVMVLTDRQRHTLVDGQTD